MTGRNDMSATPRAGGTTADGPRSGAAIGRTTAMLCLLLLVTPPTSAQEMGPGRLLASRDVRDRKAAIGLLRDGQDADDEKLLQRALKDKEWEVVELATRALATRGTDASTDRLVKLALSGPVRRIRIAAAESLRAIAPEEGAADLARRLKGRDALRAAEALSLMGGPTAAKALEELAEDEDRALRSLALRGLARAGGPEYEPRFRELLRHGDLLVRIDGLFGVARSRDPGTLKTLIEHLGRNPLSDVEERRVRYAVAEHLGSLDADARLAGRQHILGSLRANDTPTLGPRLTRLVSDAAQRSDDDRAAAEETLMALLGSVHAGNRSAAVAALARIDSEPGARRALELARKDPTVQVRFHALRFAVRQLGVEAREVVLAILSNSDEPEALREDAAALCGIHGLAGVEDALIAACADRRWPVAAAAAISLGKLRAHAAAPTLAAMLESDDWRRRGAGALALGWLRNREATDLLIRQLDDKDPTVKATIQRLLERITAHDGAETRQQWESWWRREREGFTYRDRAADQKRAEEEGYALSGYGAYVDLDVVVLLTREGGDNIQFLLERLGIEHRTTKRDGVKKAGLHPFAVFISNCPGEISAEDSDRLDFFIRSGGYLFGSCWALSETIEKIVPGIVTRFPTQQQVLDTVTADPVPSDGPFLDGVFRPGTLTQYVLEGSHLIQVRDPERFEVLIDSAECAARWGEGNLAGWFTVGHGLVFDSANHFDLQGMKRSQPKTIDERKAFALDFLGYSYPELRAIEATGVFKSAKRSEKELEDLSMFRLITNFVRQKRRAEF